MIFLCDSVQLAIHQTGLGTVPTWLWVDHFHILIVSERQENRRMPNLCASRIRVVPFFREPPSTSDINFGSVAPYHLMPPIDPAHVEHECHVAFTALQPA